MSNAANTFACTTCLTPFSGGMPESATPCHCPNGDVIFFCHWDNCWDEFLFGDTGQTRIGWKSANQVLEHVFGPETAEPLLAATTMYALDESDGDVPAAIEHGKFLLEEAIISISADMHGWILPQDFKLYQSLRYCPNEFAGAQ